MTEAEDERPPLFKSWNRWYVLLLGALAVQIVIYYAITQYFS